MMLLNKLSKPLVIVAGALCVAPVPSVFAKTYVIPHMLEKSGSISSVNFTFDTTLFMTYNQSLSGADKGSATVDLYLYDEQTGELMKGNGGNNVCAPCTFQLGGQARKLSIRMDDLILNSGGFDTDLKLGFGVIVVRGTDPDAVNIQGFVVNSHTGPFDLSVFGFDPVPLDSTSAAPQPRRSYTFPHVLETSGRVSSDPYSFDTTIFATYTGGLAGTPPGSNATVEVYLYDQATGQPMIGGGGVDVCNPCAFPMGTGASGTATPRKRTIVIDDLIVNAGGFGGASAKQGFAVVVVGGDDPANVALQGFVVNAHSGPFDISALVMEPQQVKTNPPATVKTWVIPHILEKSGLISVENFTFDTTIFATYAGGIADVPPGSGASLELYLYDDGGGLMRGSNGLAVCNPCVFALGTNNAAGNPRKQSIRIDDLIMNQGGFDTSVKLGYGIVVVSGDNSNVSLQGFVVNSHSGPLDLSVFGFEPQPIAASARVPGTGSPGAPRRTWVIPHVLERSGTIQSATFTFDTTLYMTYAGGLPGSVASNGASAKLFLYDNAGLPLTGATGAVCNPCMFDLSTATRKVSINVDDLIVTRGGGYGGVQIKTGVGVIVLDGDADDVNLQGFVVNSHTSAFDLSVFGFEPQPLEASSLRPMPISISSILGNVLISVPTVIGGHYLIESMERLDKADKSVTDKFDGDGTVQTRVVPATNSASFFRVNGY